MKRLKVVGIYVSGLVLAWPGFVLANSIGDPSYRSNNYSINESYVGDGGDGTGTSANYSNGGSVLGDIGVGNSSSANYQTNSGFKTADDPSLIFSVNTTNVNLGTLSSSAKSTGTATFSVKDYTSYGYVVSVSGTAPTNSGHALTALTSDTASSAGTEQFGLNTVLNTTAGVGANPVQVPGSGFSYGVAGDGTTGTFGTNRPYTVSDKWRFGQNETIASSPKASGQTDFTVTFMANIAPTTPGGQYVGNIILTATGTY